MTPEEKILNTIGLIFGILGGIVWIFSPQSGPSEDVSIGFTDSQPLPKEEQWLGCNTVGEYRQKIRKINARITCRLRLALILIILAFVFQLLAVWK
ncbi:MAG TPA: hypothetical protein VNU95_00435 [Candidatus Acidoferrales bacterium]|jgi:hypothetical protein|nr:hypothetical protein [Candidatus Acidoferrales bacterium]